MSIFIDTSVFYAYVSRGDEFHPTAVGLIKRLLQADNRLYTSNYVILETNALLQRRLGMRAVRRFDQAFTPLLEIIWVDATLHQAGLAMLLTANRRGLSLVDCTSFEIMRRHGINTAVTVDGHFAEQGFDVLSESS